MRVLLVDDHPMIHEVLGAVARGVFPGADVEVASDLAQAIERAGSGALPDLVLLDLGLPGCSGIDALTTFRNAYPHARVVVVSANEDRASVVGALEAGAAGYVPKTHAPPLVAAALRVVAEGGTYVPPQALQEGECAQHVLTERQLDVLRLMAKGMCNKEIAQRLRIAKDTVKQHAKALYAALGVASRNQAGLAAQRRGIKLD
ncbi:MAG: response regulator [Burkholderiales bacterium]